MPEDDDLMKQLEAMMRQMRVDFADVAYQLGILTGILIRIERGMTELTKVIRDGK